MYLFWNTVIVYVLVLGCNHSDAVEAAGRRHLSFGAQEIIEENGRGRSRHL
jgi:hypothetical protein